MSIDARVDNVVVRFDGSGYLGLVDRPPARPGETPGIAGQTTLYFDKSPTAVWRLKDKNIWGCSSSLMLVETEIAKREGYGKIIFASEAVLKRALEAYDKKPSTKEAL